MIGIAALIAMPAISFAGGGDCSEAASEKANSLGDSFPHDHQLMDVVGKGRVQFYSAPDRQCAMKGVFVIPGDRVSAYTSYNGFASVQYVNLKNGNIVLGWVDENRIKTSRFTSSPSN